MSQPRAADIEISDGVAVVTLSQPERKVNALSRAVVDELSGVVESIEHNQDIRGVIFRSGKPGHFVAGADLREIRTLMDGPTGALDSFLGAGHALFERIARAAFPSAAVIDGVCLGGGLELALACDIRVCAESSTTMLGFPEVMLGLIPAWGGTQRLPRQVGVRDALQMIVGGKPLTAQDAASIGLVDAVVPAARVVDEARRRLVRLTEARTLDDVRAPRRERVSDAAALDGCWVALLDQYVLDTEELTWRARRAAGEVVVKGCGVALEEGLAIERRAAAEVFQTMEARRLVSAFLERGATKRDAEG